MTKSLIQISYILLLFQSCKELNNKKSKIDQEPRITEKCKLMPQFSNEEFSVNHCEIFEDGKKIRQGFYANGIAIKEHSFYELGIKRVIREYVMDTKTSSVVNNVYYLFENGDTNILKSNYYTVKFEKDTFDIIDSIKFSLSLTAPFYKNSKSEVTVGNSYNKEAWISPINKSKSFFSFAPVQKEGSFNLGGQIREMKINPDSSGESRDLRLTDYFYVKNKTKPNNI